MEIKAVLRITAGRRTAIKGKRDNGTDGRGKNQLLASLYSDGI